jgi:RNA polymerase sigma factor (sigma-70 family)
MQNETFELIDLAVNGDKKALEVLLFGVQDMIYNLSLRMLGNPHDAEDATQEILIRIITKLSTFKKESSFSTWVYRIATNHLLNYKKGFFAKLPPLSFEFYGQDINNGFIENNPSPTQGVEEALLSEELKMSCTNVMLQCFEPEDRIIYILGTMFRVDSKICGEILEITPEAYRKRLSRLRAKMGDFLSTYCELGSSRSCSCTKRIGYAISSHRLNPANLEYLNLGKIDESKLQNYTQAMEHLDDLSFVFGGLPKYHSPQILKNYIYEILASNYIQTVKTEI